LKNEVFGLKLFKNNQKKAFWLYLKPEIEINFFGLGIRVGLILHCSFLPNENTSLKK
jgi:hypothetical protein